MKNSTKAAVTGALAGLANGFFGSGGGMIIIPLFLRWLKLDERQAFATSVFAIAPMCAASAAIYFLQGAFCFSDALPFLIGGLAGGFLGGLVFKKIPLGLLRTAFGIMMIYGGIRSLL